MSSNVLWDSYSSEGFDLGYNHLERELSDLPRLVNGSNTLVTTGGKLRRRYGTNQPFGASLLTNVRVDRCVVYETMENSATGVTQNPPHVYLVMSVLNLTTNLWEVWYQELKNAGPSVIPAAKLGTLRGMDKSQAPHEMVVARGKCYIKGTPSLANDSTALGSVIFDGTSGVVNVYPWGSLPPTTPQALYAYGTLATAITAAQTTTVNVNNPTTGTDLWSGAGAPVLVIDNEMIQTSNIFSSTGGASNATGTLTRAQNGTIAAAHSQGTPAYTAAPAPSETDNFVINFGYIYATALKSITGQYTNRTSVTQAFSTSNFIPPSFIFPFQNARGINNGFIPTYQGGPSLQITGNTDTVNYPTIAIFRTTDGGGTFYLLDEVTNTGVSQVNYNDNWSVNNLYTGNTRLSTPVPDYLLTGFATTTTSNSPPPSVIAPQIIGTNVPVTCTPMAYFQGRIWYGLGNILFFSSQEETLLGVPEECFPSGINGNFWRLQHPIVSMISTSSTLYVFTYQHCYAFTGNSLNTFTYQPLFEGFGMNPLQNQAITRFGENVAFMTQDYRICTITNGMLNTISDPLFNDLINFATTGGNQAQFQIRYYSTIDREWLVICGNHLGDNNQSRQWVYDLKKARGATSEREPAFGGMYTPTQNFWYTPWNINSSCCVVSRQSPANTTNGLYFFIYDANLKQSQLVIQQIGSTTDQQPSGVQTYDIDMQFNMNRVVAGDHVNKERVPGITPIIYKMTLDRTIFNGDTDPDVYYFKDDIWNMALPTPPAENPARRDVSIGYKTLEYPVNEVAQRIAFEIKKVGSADDFELQNMSITFEPEGGA